MSNRKSRYLQSAAADIRQFNRTTIAKAVALVPGVTSSLTNGCGEQTFTSVEYVLSRLKK